MTIKLRKKAIRKKTTKTDWGEKLTVSVERVERIVKDTEKGIDIKKEGYAYFKINIDANGKKIETKKRIRLDKPERMTKKFIQKLKPLAEREYCENTYFVAQQAAPETFLTHITNEEVVMDKMLALFEEVDLFAKTGNVSRLKTTLIEF